VAEVVVELDVEVIVEVVAPWAKRERVGVSVEFWAQLECDVKAL
jgi:hypothetical protein